jgi:hypothetical protein
MNWEKSKAVTPLKCDFLQAFFSKEKRFFHLVNLVCL